MGYRVTFNFADGSSEDMLNETYDTYQEAEDEARQAASDYSCGGFYMEEAGEKRGPEMIDWYITEC